MILETNGNGDVECTEEFVQTEDNPWILLLKHKVAIDSIIQNLGDPDAFWILSQVNFAEKQPIQMQASEMRMIIPP